MSQICNTIMDNPFDSNTSALFGTKAEVHVAKGSAFFCGAFSEMLHWMAAGELGRPDVMKKRLDRTVAYLKGSLAEYGDAIRTAEKVTPDPKRKAAFGRLDYSHLYDEVVQRSYLPEMPETWERAKYLAQQSNPVDLLRAFRDDLLDCLSSVEALQASHSPDQAPTVQDAWAISTKLSQTLVFGQAVAVIYQVTLQEDAAMVSVTA